MKVEVAKTAGFCFGVDRAVKLTYELLDADKRVATFGPLIHNPQVLADLAARGVRVIDDPAEVQPGETVVIRAHGVTRAQMQALRKRGAEICDATCPFVTKMHRIVAEQDVQTAVLIAGDSSHPEVIGTMSHCPGACYPFADETELRAILADLGREKPEKRLCIVAQTTFLAEEWEKCLKIINSLCTNAVVFDTICNATQERQAEARALSGRCDCMIVIGGKESSNTAKLHAVCQARCKSYGIESAEELDMRQFQHCQTVGVTAGASTPAGIIKEVLTKMSNENEILTPQEAEQATECACCEAKETVESVEQAAIPEEIAEECAAAEEAAVPAEADPDVPPAIDLPREITDDMDFSEALEESLKSMNSDQAVNGIVMRVTPGELQVDIGRKQTGYVPADEYSLDPGVNIMDDVKVGDEMKLIIMKTNDMEGTIMLSKRRYDAMQAWEDVIAAETTGDILEGVVVEVIRGGVLVLTRGVRVFVPASLATANRGDSLDDLLRKTVKFRIIEVNRARRRAVGSIRAVTKDLRREAEEAFWDSAQVGQQFNGKVRSLTSYGAFVDVGGLDGMVHISELSWKRIKHPSDVIAVGDDIDVYIKALDLETKRISLGHKKAEDNPWEMLRNDYPVGSAVEVEVVSMTAFGAFARIIPGIDGLVHISQIADRHIEKPQDALSIGDKVMVKITAIDFDKKRVSLSIRALLDPMEGEAEGVEEDAPIAKEAAE